MDPLYMIKDALDAFRTQLARIHERMDSFEDSKVVTGALKAQVSAMDSAVIRLNKIVLDGNGKPSHVERIASLERTAEEILERIDREASTSEKEESERGEARSQLRLKVLGIGGVVLTMLLSAALSKCYTPGNPNPSPPAKIETIHRPVPPLQLPD